MKQIKIEIILTVPDEVTYNEAADDIDIILRANSCGKFDYKIVHEYQFSAA
jgi:hypothetical protein